MKLSNKILIAFFASGFVYLTAVFAEVRLRGTPNNINDTNSIAETVDIPRVRYLVLQNLGEDIAVIGSDTPRLEVRSISGNLLKRLEYNISGDTLTLSAFETEEENIVVMISVYVADDGLEAITVNDAAASVKNFEKDLLYLSQNGGRVWLADSEFGRLSISVAGKSNLHINATSLDTLTANIDHSEVTVSTPLTLLQGSMGNNSFLRMNAVTEIQFRKDATSRINMWE